MCVFVCGWAGRTWVTVKDERPPPIKGLCMGKIGGSEGRRKRGIHAACTFARRTQIGFRSNPACVILKMIPSWCGCRSFPSSPGNWNPPKIMASLSPWINFTIMPCSLNQDTCVSCCSSLPLWRLLQTISQTCGSNAASWSSCCSDECEKQPAANREPIRKDSYKENGALHPDMIESCCAEPRNLKRSVKQTVCNVLCTFE